MTDASKSLLGKTTNYSNSYSPSLLFPLERAENRRSLAMPSELPFQGEDVWTGYELSWLNMSGKPVIALAEFHFPADSTYMIESKSFKLYLNSFNQSKFANIDNVQKTLAKDLSATAGVKAQVKLFAVDNCPALDINADNQEVICIDNEDISVESYQYQPELLRNSQEHDLNEIITENLVSHLLKSNCLITNQPDWASVYISYEGQAINHGLLLKYLISFRQHNEFHEQCVERIFCDLQTYCNLKKLTVFARYTRRGGLDINPFRSTHLITAPQNRTLRQ